MKRFTKLFTLFLAITFLCLNIASPDVFASSEKQKDYIIKGCRAYISTDDVSNYGVKAKKEGNKVKVYNSYVTMEFNIDSNKVSINNINVTLDCKTFEEKGKVYVPYRMLLETLNYKLTWLSTTKSVSFSKQSGDTTKYPLTIKNGENKIVIDKEPQKIVSLAPGVTEKLYELGAFEKLVGRTQYCKYPSKVKDIKNVGTLFEPNIETIIDLEPDLALAETHFKKEILDKLSQAGIASASAKTPVSIEGIYDQMLLMGKIVNKNYEARALVSSMRSKVQKIKYVLNNNSNKKSIYYVVGTGQHGEYTAGSDTFIADMIRTVGATNAADDVKGWKYSVEKIIDNDPDILVGNKTNIDSMINSSNFSILSAIKNKSYEKIDSNILELSAPRAINIGLKMLFKMVHGDLVNELGF
ncbi:helical backbone metal receptor [Clostridiaceae bacterium M8S5]|nr:helical backbone metal receptor [Clostridiaceae bacterium M8S5]